MQTAHADRQTRARGIVVALYRGKVVALYRGKVVEWWSAGRVAGGGGSPRGPRAGEGSRELAEAGGKLENSGELEILSELENGES